MINHIEDIGTISTEKIKDETLRGARANLGWWRLERRGGTCSSWSTCTCLAFPHCSCQHHHHHLHHHHHDHHQVAAAPPASAALLTGLAVPHRGWHHQHIHQQHHYHQQAKHLDQFCFYHRIASLSSSPIGFVFPTLKL